MDYVFSPQPLLTHQVVSPKTDKASGQANTVAIKSAFQILPPEKTGGIRHVLLVLEITCNSSALYQTEKFALDKIKIAVQIKEAGPKFVGAVPDNQSAVRTVTSGWSISGSLDLALSPKGTFGVQYTSHSEQVPCPNILKNHSDENFIEWIYRYRDHTKSEVPSSAVGSETQKMVILVKMTDHTRAVLSVMGFVRYRRSIFDRIMNSPTNSLSFDMDIGHTIELEASWKPAAGFITIGLPKAGKSSFLNQMLSVIFSGANFKFFQEDAYQPSPLVRVREVSPEILQREFPYMKEPIRLIDTAGRVWGPASFKDDDEMLLIEKLLTGLPEGTDLNRIEDWKNKQTDFSNGIASLVLVINGLTLEKISIIPRKGELSNENLWSAFATILGDNTALKATKEPDDDHFVVYQPDPQAILGISIFAKLISNKVAEHDPKGNVYIVITHTDRMYMSLDELRTALMEHRGRDPGIIVGNTYLAGKNCVWQENLADKITKHNSKICKSDICRKKGDHFFDKRTIDVYKGLFLMIAPQ